MKLFYKLFYLFLLVCFSGLGCISLGLTDIPVKELKAKYAQPPSKFIDVDGLEVHYRDEGEGPVLVLFHGIFDSLHTWQGWVDELKPHYRIIRLDLPGWSITGPPNFKYTLKNAIDFCENFIEALDLKRFYLVGNSLGGYLAWNYALKHPEEVDKLILIDPIAYSQDVPFEVNLFTVPVIGFFGTYITPRFIMENGVEDVFGDPDKLTDDIMDRFYDHCLRPGNRTVAREILTLMADTARTEDNQGAIGIPEIKPPTLVMWGGADVWVPTALTEKWKKDLPSAKFIIYDGVGHTPQLEIPIRTAYDAHQFLSSSEK